MANGAEIRDRFEAVLRAHREQGPADDEQGFAALFERGLALLDDHEQLEARLEAREQQIEAQRAYVVGISCPVLQVRKDMLCAPVIGELDLDRAALLTETLLAAAVERRVRAAVIDLTGAEVRDPAAGGLLTGVLRALRLIGVRGCLSGVRPELAELLAEEADALRGVRCFPDLATALAWQGERS